MLALEGGTSKSPRHTGSIRDMSKRKNQDGPIAGWVLQRKKKGLRRGTDTRSMRSKRPYQLRSQEKGLRDPIGIVGSKEADKTTKKKMRNEKKKKKVRSFRGGEVPFSRRNGGSSAKERERQIDEKGHDILVLSKKHCQRGKKK